MGSSDLKVPLAAFLAESAGSVRHLEFDPITIDLDDDLVLGGPISGALELSRTNRGIFVRGDIRTTLSMDCSRCLGPAGVELAAVIREEILPALDPVTGQVVDPSIERDVMRLTEGQVGRLKVIKRQGYGRAGVPLLRARVLSANTASAPKK